MKTYSQKSTEVTRAWHLIDASEATLGRISTVAASLLLGKGKPTITAHTDGGDFVVIVNAANVKLTGGKETKKEYYRHSGYPGGLYKRNLTEQQEKDPASIIFKAVRGMLPDNKLRDGRLARLKIFAGEDHNHSAQMPVKLSMKGSK